MLVLSRRNLLSLKIYEGNPAKDIKNADTIKIPPLTLIGRSVEDENRLLLEACIFTFSKSIE